MLKVATILKDNPTFFGITWTYPSNIVQVRFEIDEEVEWSLFENVASKDQKFDVDRIFNFDLSDNKLHNDLFIEMILEY